MQLHFSSIISAPIDVTWERWLSIGKLIEFSRPLMELTLLNPPSELHWQLGSRYQFQVTFPDGRSWQHEVRVTHLDSGHFEMRTEEKGGAIQKWSHFHWLEPIGKTMCGMVDEIDFEAGPENAVIARLAQNLYGHRHRLWQATCR